MTLSLTQILKAVAERAGLTYAEIISDRRHKKLHQARCIALLLTKRHTSLSYPAMGKACGDRDHTSIMHLVKQAEKRMKIDSVFEGNVKAMEDLMFSPPFKGEALPKINPFEPTPTRDSLRIRDQIILDLRAQLEAANRAAKQAEDAVSMTNYKLELLLLHKSQKPSIPQLCPYAAEYGEATLAAEQAIYSVGEKAAYQRLQKAKDALLRHRIPSNTKPYKDQSHAHHAF